MMISLGRLAMRRTGLVGRRCLSRVEARAPGQCNGRSAILQPSIRRNLASEAAAANSKASDGNTGERHEFQVRYFWNPSKSREGRGRNFFESLISH